MLLFFLWACKLVLAQYTALKTHNLVKLLIPTLIYNLCYVPSCGSHRVGEEIRQPLLKSSSSVFVVISCRSSTFASILVTTWPMSSLHSGMFGLNRSRFAVKLRGMTWKLSGIRHNRRVVSKYLSSAGFKILSLYRKYHKNDRRTNTLYVHKYVLSGHICIARCRSGGNTCGEFSLDMQMCVSIGRWRELANVPQYLLQNKWEDEYEHSFADPTVTAVNIPVMIQT